jgi:predicted dehydrogenase
MDTIGIGMVGSGFMGLTYSEVVSRHASGATLVAVTGGSRAAPLAADYGVPAEASLDSLLARPDVQAVILATPDQLHRDPAGAAAERFRKITKMARQFIDEGRIGPVWMVRTISSFPISVTREISQTRGWMYDKSSGGLFMGIAAHNTDFLRWLTGANAVKVFAQVNTYSDIPAPAQSVMAQIVFDNGIMGHLWTSAEFPTPGFPASEVRFQVIGRDGMLDLENFEYLDVGQGDKWERVYTPERFDYLKEPKSPIRLYPHIGVVQEFIDSIREQRPPKVGGAEGRAAVEICEACLISGRTGEAVKLPL